MHFMGTFWVFSDLDMVQKWLKCPKSNTRPPVFCRDQYFVNSASVFPFKDLFLHRTATSTFRAEQGIFVNIFGLNSLGKRIECMNGILLQYQSIFGILRFFLIGYGLNRSSVNEYDMQCGIELNEHFGNDHERWCEKCSAVLR